MRHMRRGSNLGRKPAHRKVMLHNLSASIIDKGRVETTVPRAKAVRGVVERAITCAKKGDLHGIRLAARFIKDKSILHKLTSDIAPGFKDRKGGYTRIIKTTQRNGDNAPMCYIELVGRGDTDIKRKKKKNISRKPTRKSAGKVEKATADVTGHSTSGAGTTDAASAKKEGAGT